MPSGRKAVPWRTRLVECDAGYATPCLEWTGQLNRDGYGRVTIARRTYLVHRLVWTEAHGDPGSRHVLHRCDNPPCARLDHLFLGDQAANMQDMAKKGRGRGRAQTGESNNRARLTETQVRAIRAAYQPVYGSIAALAREYGVAHSTIQSIVNNKNWRHL